MIFGVIGFLILWSSNGDDVALGERTMDFITGSSIRKPLSDAVFIGLQVYVGFCALWLAITGGAKLYLLLRDGNAAPCCTDRVAEGERLFGEGFSAVAGQGCAISWPPLAAISAMQSHIPGPRLLP